MEKYLDKIAALRAEIRKLSAEAEKENRPIDPKFYEVQKDLDRVWKNLQAWCRRHKQEFPSDLMRAV